MRTVVITKHGGPGVLEVQERPDPPIGAGQVRIDVAAAGINFADVMARMGLYPDAPKPPCVVGYEVAGTVTEVGEGVHRCSPRPARAGGDLLRRLRLAGGRARRRRGRAPGPAHVRAGRGDPRQLRHRLGGPDRLREPAAGRARADPLRRGRRGHRRHPDRQAQRRRDLRHRLALQARAHLRTGRGPPARLHPRRLGAGAAEVRRDPRRRRWAQLQAQLRPAAPRCGRLVAFGASSVVSGERRNVVTALKRSRACRASTSSSRCPNRRP